MGEKKQRNHWERSRFERQFKAAGLEDVFKEYVDDYQRITDLIREGRALQHRIECLEDEIKDRDRFVGDNDIGDSKRSLNVLLKISDQIEEIKDLVCCVENNTNE